MEEKPKDTIKVLDRRKFTADGERRTGVDVPPEPPREPEPEPPPKAAAPASAPEPAVSQPFAMLVQELFQSCAMSLGAPDPVSGGRGRVDLQAANLYIDFLEALQEKTRGNLAPQEKQLLEEGLFQLKMLYTQAGAKRPQ